MDTKGDEHGYVAELIRARGHSTLVIDVGSDQSPRLKPDVTREEVARLAGSILWDSWPGTTAASASHAMGQAAATMLVKLQSEGRIDGVISLGGGGGTSICTAGMRALPLGFPKLMVSTLASGNTAEFVGVRLSC